MGQDVYIRNTHVPNIHIDNFPFSPQVWGSLRSPQLDECRALWGEPEHASSMPRTTIAHAQFVHTRAYLRTCRGVEVVVAFSKK